MSRVHTAFIYPWDDRDRIANEIDAISPKTVAVAGTYHSVRTASWAGTNGRVIDAWHSADYFGGPRVPGELRLPPPSGWAEQDAFTQTATWLRERGSVVDAWLVLNHPDAVTAGSEFGVRNARGETLVHTWCPAHEQVQEAGLRTVARALEGGASGVIFEAVAPLGASHPVEHLKTQSLRRTPEAWSFASWCFCTECVRRRDMPELEETVGAVIDGRIMADASQAIEARSILVTDRIALVGGVAAGLARRAHELGAARVSAFVDDEDDGFGPALPIGASLSADFDTVIAGAWDAPERTKQRVERLREGDWRVGAYVNVLPDRSESAVDASSVASLGDVDVYLYHLGIASGVDLAPWKI